MVLDADDLQKLRQGFLRAAESPVAEQVISSKLKVNDQPGTKRNVLLTLAEEPHLVRMHGCLVGLFTEEELNSDMDLKSLITADDYVARLEKLFPRLG